MEKGVGKHYAISLTLILLAVFTGFYLFGAYHSQAEIPSSIEEGDGLEARPETFPSRPSANKFQRQQQQPQPQLSNMDPRSTLPANLLLLDETISHHVIVVEKSTHLLHLYEVANSLPKYVRSYSIATGKTAGDKLSKGDLKTPEGIYQLTEFIPNNELIKQYGEEGKIYGVGAFVLNYPNAIDQSMNKTGGGIWIHSTNNESRIAKGLDSRGCVVLTNKELKELSQYIELHHTSVIIVQDQSFLSALTWESTRGSVQQMVSDWVAAWKTKDLEKYISFYHPNEFRDSSHGAYHQFKNYKRAVFANPGIPQIDLSHLSILNFKNYVVVQFKQTYKSHTIDDTGKKTLYLVRDENYQWKIVAELWNKWVNSSNSVAFTPSMRFFKENANTNEI